jgi:hypothetical protein
VPYIGDLNNVTRNHLDFNSPNNTLQLPSVANYVKRRMYGNIAVYWSNDLYGYRFTDSLILEKGHVSHISGSIYMSNG